MAGKKLTKAEITEHISLQTGVPEDVVHTIINGTFDALKEGLNENRTVELRGFGTFEIVTRKGRKNARNPKTGETVEVNDHGVVSFRAGKDLRQASWDLRGE
jgi:integration host factor subunit beta